MNLKYLIICLIFLGANIFPVKVEANYLPSEVTNLENSIKIIDTKRKCPLKLVVRKEGKAVNLHFQGKQELCFGNNTRVEFKLDDGSVFSAFGSNADNCEGKLLLGFGGIYCHEKQVNELVRHPIKSMLIKDIQNDILFYLNEQQSQDIRLALEKVMSQTYSSI